MKNLRPLSRKQRTAIEAAVKVAEARTAAEIVPVVLSRASRDEGAESRVGFAVALLTLSVVWWQAQAITADPQAWSTTPVIRLGLAEILLVLWIAYVFGSLAARFVPQLSLPFRARRTLRRAVEARARELFHRLRARQASSPQLVMVLLARFEGEVVILADPVCAAVLPEAALEAAAHQLAEKAKAGALASGLVRCVETLGALLAEGLPGGSDRDVNNLPGLVLPDEESDDAIEPPSG